MKLFKEIVTNVTFCIVSAGNDVIYTPTETSLESHVAKGKFVNPDAA